MGEYERAETFYQQSLDLKRKIGDRVGQATCLNNLGTVALERGQHGRAREYFEQGLER